MSRPALTFFVGVLDASGGPWTSCRWCVLCRSQASLSIRWGPPPVKECVHEMVCMGESCSFDRGRHNDGTWRGGCQFPLKRVTFFSSPRDSREHGRGTLRRVRKRVELEKKKVCTWRSASPTVEKPHLHKRVCAALPSPPGEAATFQPYRPHAAASQIQPVAVQCPSASYVLML